MKFSINQIAHLINGEVIGEGETKVHKLSNIEEAEAGSITFLSNTKYESYLYSTSASCVIVANDLTPKEEIATTLIRVSDPYVAFSTLLEEYQRLTAFRKVAIESPAFIHDSATLADEIYVGTFAYIGENATIGKHAKIYPGAYIGDNVSIGDNTIIYAGVKVYSNSVVGNNCTIHSGAVIGSDGFGFAPQKDGTYKAIPQLGNVVLHDFVDVGANTVIDCATFESTVIEKGVKLDNLIQVAHNVEIGENTVIAAQAGIAGSTKVGKQCVVGGQAGLVGHIKLADGTKVQAQSGVTKNTIESSALYGSPALGYNNYVRSYAIFRKLPEVVARIQQLEEKILNLPADK